MLKKMSFLMILLINAKIFSSYGASAAAPKWNEEEEGALRQLSRPSLGVSDPSGEERKSPTLPPEELYSRLTPGQQKVLEETFLSKETTDHFRKDKKPLKINDPETGSFLQVSMIISVEHDEEGLMKSGDIIIDTDRSSAPYEVTQLFDGSTGQEKRAQILEGFSVGPWGKNEWNLLWERRSSPRG